MKKRAAAHRARGVLIGRIGMTESTAAMLACAASLAAVVAGCGEPRDGPRPTYVGSDRIKAVVARYEPAGKDSLTMAGDVPILMPGSPARATLVAKGTGPMTARLPGTCPAAPIEARVGRLVLLRRDRWRTPDGGEIAEVQAAEMVDALCGDFRGRDVPNPALREKSTES